MGSSGRADESVPFVQPTRVHALAAGHSNWHAGIVSRQMGEQQLPNAEDAEDAEDAEKAAEPGSLPQRAGMFL